MYVVAFDLIGLQSFMFELRCFDISFGKLENSNKKLNKLRHCKRPYSRAGYFIKAIKLSK